MRKELPYYPLNHFVGSYPQGNPVVYSFQNYCIAYGNEHVNQWCIYRYNPTPTLFNPSYILEDFEDTLEDAIRLIHRIIADDYILVRYETVRYCKYCKREERKVEYIKESYPKAHHWWGKLFVATEGTREVYIRTPERYEENYCSHCYEEQVEKGLQEDLPF